MSASAVCVCMCVYVMLLFLMLLVFVCFAFVFIYILFGPYLKECLHLCIDLYVCCSSRQWIAEVYVFFTSVQ